MGIRYSKNAVGNFGRLSCKKIAIGGICSISSVRTVGSSDKNKVKTTSVNTKLRSKTLRKRQCFLYLTFYHRKKWIYSKHTKYHNWDFILKER